MIGISPGPWKINKYKKTSNSTRNTALTIKDSDNRYVVTGYCKSEADARLMAAGPEMLRELIKKELKICYSYAPFLWKAHLEACPSIAVIAKGTGLRTWNLTRERLEELLKELDH